MASSATAANAGAGADAATGTPALAKTEVPKKLHGRAFYESLGSPKYIVAPMVDQSEFAWRMLTRSFLPPSKRGTVLAYSPMLHARLFIDSQKYRDQHFQPTREPLANTEHPRSDYKKRQGDVIRPPSPPGSPPEPSEPAKPWLDGNPAMDRPLIVQFCANDPAELLAAARLVAPYCDAVDLNLGCPQGIAKRGRYGAFLQEDQRLVYDLVRALHEGLPVPVTAKIRVLETREATLAYARNVLAAGASFLTVHGRRREQKGHATGLADWAMIRFLRDSLPPGTVLFANGNVLRRGDLARCLEATGADAVMSAEGNLSNPAMFAAEPGEEEEELLLPGEEQREEEGGESGAEDGREFWRGRDGRGGWRVDSVMRRYLDILHRHVVDQDPPPRRPLFVPGDDEAWLREAAAADAAAAAAAAAATTEATGEPPSKKRKKDGGGKGDKNAALLASSPNMVAVQAHLFHLLRHFVSRHHDVRDALARSRAGQMPAYENVLAMVERRVAEGLLEYERTGGRSVEEEWAASDAAKKTKGAAAPAQQTADKEAEAKKEGENAVKEQQEEEEEDPESSAKTVRECRRPWWVVQPIVRPLPKEALAKGALTLKRDKAKPAGSISSSTDSPTAAAAAEPPRETHAVPAGADVPVAALEEATSFPQSQLVSG